MNTSDLYQQFESAKKHNPMNSEAIELLIKLEEAVRNRIQGISKVTNEAIDDALENDPEVRKTLTALIKSLGQKVQTVEETATTKTMKKNFKSANSSC